MERAQARRLEQLEADFYAISLAALVQAAWLSAPGEPRGGRLLGNLVGPALYPILRLVLRIVLGYVLLPVFSLTFFGLKPLGSVTSQPQGRSLFQPALAR